MPPAGCANICLCLQLIEKEFMTISKQISGRNVEARPVFRGGPVLTYWEGIVNGRTLAKKFYTPDQIFDYVEQLPQDKR